MSFQLDVAQVCGSDVISRSAGAKLRNALLANWSEETIVIRTPGLQIRSSSFFDEAIGLLLLDFAKTPDELKGKLKFPDLDPSDRQLLNDVVRKRLADLENS